MALCADDSLLKARIGARLATAQMLLPAEDSSYLQDARASVEAALEVLTAQGNLLEIAEAEMNYGLILQILPRLKPEFRLYQRLSTRASYL